MNEVHFFCYGHWLQLTTSIVIFLTIGNGLLGHFNDRKTKEEGGEDASSQSARSFVCCSFSQWEIEERRCIRSK